MRWSTEAKAVVGRCLNFQIPMSLFLSAVERQPRREPSSHVLAKQLHIYVIEVEQRGVARHFVDLSAYVDLRFAPFG